jgi:hypothetical protein
LLVITHRLHSDEAEPEVKAAEAGAGEIGKHTTTTAATLGSGAVFSSTALGCPAWWVGAVGYEGRLYRPCHTATRKAGFGAALLVLVF